MEGNAEISDKLIEYMFGDRAGLKNVGDDGKSSKEYMVSEIAVAGSLGLLYKNPVAKIASYTLALDMLFRAGNYIGAKINDKDAKIENQPGIVGSIRGYLKKEKKAVD